MIRIRQCRQDCCIVREPSKRFWYIHTPATTETVTSFSQAVLIADAHKILGAPS
jgi:hypothetical protein